MTGTLREDWYTFMIISRSVLLRMINFSYKSGRENQNTHFCSKSFFPLKTCLFLDNVEKYCRTEQATNGNMAHAHSVMDIEGYRHKCSVCSNYYFQPKQWLHERVPVLRNTYLACLVITI